MFVSVMKNKFVRWVIYAVLGVFSLYNGIACAAVLYKAGGQPLSLIHIEMCIRDRITPIGSCR